MSFQSSNNAYLTYNTNPFDVPSSTTLNKIQEHDKSVLGDLNKLEKPTITPYRSKFIAFVGVLGPSTKSDDFISRGKELVPITPQECLCYVEDDDGERSSIQLRRCKCTLSICDAEVDSDLSGTGDLQAELSNILKNQQKNVLEGESESVKSTKGVKKLMNGYQNDFQIWNVIESSPNNEKIVNLSTDTSENEEIKSPISTNTSGNEEEFKQASLSVEKYDDGNFKCKSPISTNTSRNEEEFKQASISVEKYDDGNFKCKYTLNGKSRYCASKYGKSWKIEIYTKNSQGNVENKSNEEHISEELEAQEKANECSKNSLGVPAVEVGLVKKVCEQIEKHNGSSTENSSLENISVKTSNHNNCITLTIPITAAGSEKSKILTKRSARTNLLRSKNPHSFKQRSTIPRYSIIKNWRDLKYGSGQLTSGVVPDELRAYIYNNTETSKKSSSNDTLQKENESFVLPFDTGEKSAWVKNQKLDVYAYSTTESCSHVLSKLQDTNTSRLTEKPGGVTTQTTCDSDCKTADMLKTLQDKIKTYEEKMCPSNCETVAVIQELQKKIEELQNHRPKETIKNATNIRGSKISVYSQTSGLNELKDSSTTTPEKNQAEQKSCPVSCQNETVIKLLQTKIDELEKSCHTSCYNNSTIKLLQRKIDKLQKVLPVDVKSSKKEIKTSFKGTSTQAEQDNKQMSVSPKPTLSEFMPSTSGPRVCPSTCQDEVFVKVIHDRIKNYIKSCPSSCYNNSLIKVLQNKIEQLERGVPNYDRNAKRNMKDDIFGLPDPFQQEQTKQVFPTQLPDTQRIFRRNVTLSNSDKKDVSSYTTEQLIFNKTGNRKLTPYLLYEFEQGMSLLPSSKDAFTAPEPPPQNSKSTKETCCNDASFIKALQDKITQYETTCPMKCYNSSVVRLLQQQVASLERAFPNAVTNSEELENSTLYDEAATGSSNVSEQCNKSTTCTLARRCCHYNCPNALPPHDNTTGVKPKNASGDARRVKMKAIKSQICTTLKLGNIGGTSKKVISCDNATCKQNSVPCRVAACRKRYSQSPVLLGNKVRPNCLTPMFSCTSPKIKKTCNNECCDAKAIKKLEKKIDALEKALPSDLQQIKALQDQFNEWNKKVCAPDFCEAIKQLHAKVDNLEKTYNASTNEWEKRPRSPKCKDAFGKLYHRSEKHKNGKLKRKSSCPPCPVIKKEKRDSDVPPHEETPGEVYKVEVSYEKAFEHMYKFMDKQCPLEKIEEGNEISSSKSQQIKLYLKKKFRHDGNLQAKSSRALSSSIIKAHASVESLDSNCFISFEGEKPKSPTESEQQLLRDELGMQRNELKELKLLLQRHIQQVEKQGKYKNVTDNTAIVQHATVDETSTKPENSVLKGIEPYKYGVEKPSTKLRGTKPCKHQSSQTNLDSCAGFNSPPGRKLCPQEAKSQSCPDCHIRKEINVKEYSKSEIIQSQGEKKQKPKRRRKKLWLLMLCKLCFCR